MKQLRVLVADEDPFFLKQLTGFLMRAPEGFDVCSFTTAESLDRFLQDGGQAHILLLSEELRPAVTQAHRVPARILLVERGGGEAEGFVCLRKYQRVSELVDAVMLAYDAVSGGADHLTHGEKRTRIIGVWSPVGGCGKTTLALLLARQMALDGKRAFYQCCEHVDSTRSLLPQDGKIGLSELLVSIHSGEAAAGLVMSSRACTPPELGFSYVNAADSALELGELPAEERAALFTALAGTGRFDALFLDFDTELNGDKLELLTLCDRVLIPFLPDRLGLGKLAELPREGKLRPQLERVLSRAVFAANKITPGAEGYLQSHPACAAIGEFERLPLSGQIANLDTALRARSEAELPLRRLLERLLAE